MTVCPVDGETCACNAHNRKACEADRERRDRDVTWEYKINLNLRRVLINLLITFVCIMGVLVIECLRLAGVIG